jgi:hypothetical protein
VAVRGGGLSLRKVAEQFGEGFNRTAPSNTVMLSVVTKFRLSGNVLSTEGEIWSTSYCFDKRESRTCSPAGAAFALTKPTMNGSGTERH